MEAAVWYGKGKVKIEDMAVPQPGPGEVRLKVKVCGICGSDLHEYREGPFLIPTRPHPLTGREGGPVVLGHEFSSQVDALGDGVEGIKAGERVTVNALIVCGRCHYCRKGQYNMCMKLGTLGFATDGAFAEYIVVPEYGLFRLPASVDDDSGAFVEPLAVAVRAVKRARVQMGQTAAVIGAGPIGLLVMQVCRTAGVSKVFMVEPIRERRELASRLGASEVIDPAKTDAGKTIAELTDGLRADVALDCVGNQASFDTAVKVTGRRAVICIVGMSLKPIQVPFLRLWGHEKEITFTTGYEDEFSAAIGLLADRRVNVADLVTGRIKLRNLVQKGFHALMDAPAKHIKILVYPE
ncbi:MAG: 2,3-butanediol dehydrogenase [Desulfomonilaceae bacterium]